MRKALLFKLASTAVLVVCGCGFPARTNFPNALTGPDGQTILFDDVLKIVNDSTLSDDEKRTALRALGLEDERLIDALINA